MWAEADINGIKLWEGGGREGERLFSSVGTCKNIGPIHIVPTPPPHARPLITLLVSLVARPPRRHLTQCSIKLEGFSVISKFLILIVQKLGCKIQIRTKSLNDSRHNKCPLHGITWEAHKCFYWQNTLWNRGNWKGHFSRNAPQRQYFNESNKGDWQLAERPVGRPLIPMFVLSVTAWRLLFILNLFSHSEVWCLLRTICEIMHMGKLGKILTWHTQHCWFGE